MLAAASILGLLLTFPPAVAGAAFAVPAPTVDDLQTQIATAVQNLSNADAAASAAAEDFNTSAVHLQAATAKADAAAALARQAQARAEVARERVGAMAAEMYRKGAITGTSLLLASDSPDQLLDRAGVIQVLGRARAREVQRAQAGQMVADSFAEQAAKARADRVAASAALDTSRKHARQTFERATVTVSDLHAELDDLVARLARARGVSLEAEWARQEELAEAAQEAAQDEGRGRQVPGPSDPGPSDPGPTEPEPGPTAPETQAPEPKPTTPKPTRTEPAEPTPTKKPTPRPSPSPKPTDPESPSGGDSSGSAAGGRAALAWAKTQLGLPYQWGGDGPDSYDCSGLTMRAWQRGGVGLPHSSRMQYAQVRKISLDDLRPGDLLFWSSRDGDPSGIHHVALYAGGGQMVEAPATGLKVRLVPIRWRHLMPNAGRP